MRNKYRNYDSAMLILVKRYPDCIEVCPNCCHITYSNIDRQKAVNKCKTSFEFHMLYIPFFRCSQCSLYLQGQKWIEAWTFSHRIITTFLKEVPEEKQTMMELRCRLKEYLNAFFEIKEDWLYNLVVR